jgi:hypothetical protein
MPELHDVSIECMRCRSPFVWTIGEQQWYADHGLVAPRHCKPCRKKLKQLRWTRAREAGGQQ